MRIIKNKEKYLIIGAFIGLMLGILWFVFLSETFAKQEDKVYWCHTEPNGNFQTLHLPLQALENAGHVNANGNPLHAGDYAGVCNEPSISPSPTVTITPSPTVEPTITIEPSVTPTPCPSGTILSGSEFTQCIPIPTNTVTPSPTSVPQNNTEVTKEENKTSNTENKVEPTLIPCSPTTCVWK